MMTKPKNVVKTQQFFLIITDALEALLSSAVFHYYVRWEWVSYSYTSHHNMHSSYIEVWVGGKLKVHILAYRWFCEKNVHHGVILFLAKCSYGILWTCSLQMYRLWAKIYVFKKIVEKSGFSHMAKKESQKRSKIVTKSRFFSWKVWRHHVTVD